MAKKKLHSKKRKTRKKSVSRIELILSALVIIGAVMLLVRYFNPPTTYHLMRLQDGKQEDLGTYHSLKEARNDMYQKADASKHINMAVYDGDKRMMAIAYGIVDFRGNNCQVNVSYTRESDGKTGYTNGCYGADGLYLDTSEDGKQVKFQQSGAIGWVDLDQVELRDYFQESEVASIQYYEVKDARLHHKITTDVTKSAYAATLDLGTVDLADGYYYSYDGHYFYNSFALMSDDLRRGTHEHSVNEKPYYNFYQFVSHRSISKYTAEDINWYVENYLGFTDKKSSLLYNSGAAFVKAQNTYGSNAIMMFALAENESDFGRSAIAREKNNLFGHAAYDASPTESSSAYKNVQESIIVHAKDYLNKGYLNPDDTRYHGSYFGDKGSGMNVMYASDPYWGEKASVYYRTFDEISGGKDEKNIHRFIKDGSYKVYDKVNGEVLYTVKEGALSSFEVLSKSKDHKGKIWLKVRSDYALKNHEIDRNNHVYPIAESYGYILDDDA